MRGGDHRIQLRDGMPSGVRGLADSLNLPRAPMLHTSAAGKTGMTFIEIASGSDNAGTTDPVCDDAFLIALQLKPCPDFDLYADGHIIRPRAFDTGSVAIFDLRMNLAMERRDPFHAVDLYLPRRALDALTEDANASMIHDLRHEPGKALQDPIARHLLLTMQPALAANSHASDLFVDHVAMALATHIAHSYGGMRPRPDHHTGTLARWQERRAKELLAANLTGNITLEDLAKVCELSVRQFTRAFRGSTGMSPHAWLLQLKIERAKQRLSHSREMLAGIALECGFADQSHMTRVFQRALGLTPSAWRRLHQR